jgi:FkbM family methyltransferase
MKHSLVFNVVEGVFKRTGRMFNNPYKKIGISSFKFRKIKNLPAYKPQTIEFLGSKVSFGSRVEFLHSIHEIFIDEIYRQKFDKEDPYIIDCGANIGLSVIYMKRLYPKAEIIAFEPDDTNYSYLEKNIRAFDFANVTICKEAIWKENTTLNFLSEGSLASRIGGEEGKTIKVKAKRLRDLLDRPVDFLKIDIEGAEYEVLKDIKDRLHVVNNIFLEYHGTFEQNKELNEMLGIVTDSGFRYYIKQALDNHPVPFVRKELNGYDVQLNIFCFRKA